MRPCNLAPAVIMASLLLPACSLPPSPLEAGARQAQAPQTLGRNEALRQDVITGMTRIFERYDDAPRDARLSFAEFGRVVTREWFDAHDPDGDGFMKLTDWMTPEEIVWQIGAIQGMAGRLVARADRDGDARLSAAEWQADRDLEIDPTPWLAGAPDPAVKATAFARHADAAGSLTAEAAALMIGALMAEGYYVSDPDSVRSGRGLLGRQKG